MFCNLHSNEKQAASSLLKLHFVSTTADVRLHVFMTIKAVLHDNCLQIETIAVLIKINGSLPPG